MLFDIKIHRYEDNFTCTYDVKTSTPPDPDTWWRVPLWLRRTVYYCLNAMRVRRVYYYCREIMGFACFSSTRRVQRLTETHIFITISWAYKKKYDFSHAVSVAWFTNKSAHFVIFRTSHALPRSVDICEFNVTSSVIIDIFSTPLAGFSFHTTYYDVLEDAISKKKKVEKYSLLVKWTVQNSIV